MFDHEIVAWMLRDGLAVEMITDPNGPPMIYSAGRNHDSWHQDYEHSKTCQGESTCDYFR
jgi:hypothetical protein